MDQNQPISTHCTSLESEGHKEWNNINNIGEFQNRNLLDRFNGKWFTTLQ